MTTFGFVPLSWPLLTVLLIVSATYVAATELTKWVVFPVAVPMSDVHGAG
jgi:hypothetical protein